MLPKKGHIIRSLYRNALFTIVELILSDQRHRTPAAGHAQQHVRSQQPKEQDSKMAASPSASSSSSSSASSSVRDNITQLQLINCEWLLDRDRNQLKESDAATVGDININTAGSILHFSADMLHFSADSDLVRIVS